MKKQNPKSGNENLNQILIHPDHPKPVTRRQMLASGIIGMSGYVTMPAFLQWMLNPTTALAAGACEATRDPSLIPLMIFDCAGGAALSGNFLVGKEGGPMDFLSTYDRMGIPTTPQAGEPIDNSMGVPMFTNLSQIRAGMVAAMSPEAKNNLRMGTVCTLSQDDTGSNALNFLALALRAGATGTFVSNGVGTRNSVSGGNSMSLVNDATLRSLFVPSADGLISALSYGAAIDALTLPKKQALARAIKNISASQAEKLGNMMWGEQIKVMSDCGYTKNIDNADKSVTAAQVDPRIDANAQAIYNITPTSTGAATQSAAIAYNVLKGTTGPGSIVIGGCDYHDGTQTTGDAKDLQIGTEIGRAVELAHRMGKPLFFAIISDGAISSDQGTRVWRGDASAKSLMVIGYYRPAGPANMQRIQLGYYREGQGVERSTYIGNDPKKGAAAAFANYLNVCGKIGNFGNLVTISQFNTAMLDSHIVFDG